MKLLKSFATLCTLGALGAVYAIDYSEEEPNDAFPPNFLTGNPVFQSGDRLVGSITADDFDLQYLTFQGTGAPGLWRYTFDFDTGGGDSVGVLFDTTPSGWFLASNDDFPGLGLSSRLVYDHFDTTGANQVFGVGLFGFSEFDEFDYAMSWTRTAITTTNLGVLGGGSTSVGYNSTAGGGVWFQFTLATAGEVTIDTLSTLDDTLDSELALYDANGNTIGGNDDAPGGGTLLSGITKNLAAGTYYVAAGSFDSFYDWDNTLDTNLGMDRSGFSSDVFEDPYTLTITTQAVPEPATMAALGLGALALLRRRRKV